MKLTNFAIISLVTLAVCVLVAQCIRMGAPTYMLSLLAVPIGVFFINYQRLLLILVLFTMFSGLRVPGLPASVDMYMLLSAAYIGLRIVNMAMRKSFLTIRSPSTLFALAFIINLLAIVFIRGSGLRITGGDQWGGMRYLDVILPVSLLFFPPSVAFTPQEWRKILIGILIFSSIPFFSEMLYLVSRGMIYHQYYFVSFRGGTYHSIMGESMGRELIRFQSANRFGVLLILSALMLFLHRRHLIKAGLLYLPGVLLIGMSGHRSGFIDFVFMTWVVGLIRFWNHRWTYILSSLFFGLAGLFFLYQGAHYLPLPFQRMISFLPGIQIIDEARLDALSTVDWRFSLWLEALNEIKSNPTYLVLGKGLNYSASEYEALMLFDYHYWWAVLTSNYHQGFLSLLIITGIPGLIFATGMMGTALFLHIRSIMAQPIRTIFSASYVVLVIYCFLIIGKFFVIYGDLTTTFSLICYVLFLLELLRSTSSRYAAQ